jgi:hypothetical protein
MKPDQYQVAHEACMKKKLNPDFDSKPVFLTLLLSEKAQKKRKM